MTTEPEAVARARRALTSTDVNELDDAIAFAWAAGFRRLASALEARRLVVRLRGKVAT